MSEQYIKMVIVYGYFFITSTLSIFKISGLIDWTWLQVLSPILFSALFLMLFYIVIYAIGFWILLSEKYKN